MAGALTAAIASIFSGSAVTADPYFEYTTLLLPGSGTNGAQNNTFLDGSTNNFTITRNGNTTQGTFSPFSQTGWGNYFDGSLYYLTASGNPNITTNFTIEFWFYMPSWGDRVFLSQGGGAASFSTSNGVAYQIYATSTTFYVQWSNGAGGQVEISTPTSGISTNTWHHVAIGNNATTTRLWIDGTSIGTNTSNPTWYYPTTRSTYIGYISYTSSYRATGYLSNVRIVTSDVYGANNSTITVPTSPLTAITNTQLLTCQSNRFRDASNTYTLTVTGTPSVVAFSPFNPTASWSAATYGGSGYFDGSGDYLTSSINAIPSGSTPFTVEAWIYPTAFSGTSTIFGGVVNIAEIQFASTGISYNKAGVAGILSSSTALTLNAWNHIAVVRNGSNNSSILLNGVRLTTTASDSNTFSATTSYIGSGGATQYCFGYLSNFRFVVGTAVYDPTQTTYTVPTAPLTAITNTSLLLNFTNAGVYDATSKNDLETVGNAQISTAQYKFPPSSMAFDGTGDYLSAANISRGLEMLTGDFTIECWIRFNVVGNGQIVTGLAATNTLYWQYYSSQLAFGQNNVSSIAATNWSPSSGVWYHIAVTRSGSTVRQFVDGTQLGSNATSSASFANGPIQIGDGGAGGFNGYIQDLRITKGYARYTANFTPPTAAFPTL